MSTVKFEYVSTVNRLLLTERQGTLEEIQAELERLAAHPYFRGSAAEPGLRVAVSAVKRLKDSRHLRVAEPDDLAPSLMPAQRRTAEPADEHHLTFADLAQLPGSRESDGGHFHQQQAG